MPQDPWEYRKEEWAVEALVKRYRRLIYATIKRMKGMSFLDTSQDLEEEGMLALLTGIQSFDTTRGTKPEDYLIGVIRRYLSKQCMMEGMSWRLSKVLGEIKKVERDATIMLHRVPTCKEIADRVGIPQEELLSIEKQKVDIVPLEESEYPLHSAVDPYAALCKKESIEFLGDARKRLAPEQQRLLSMLYDENMSMKDVAQYLGCDPSTVTRNHTKALERLRGMLDMEAMSW